MEELITRIVSNIGIDEALAQKAVGMLLGFLQDQGDSGMVAGILDQMPGASDLIAQASGGESSGGGGLLGSVMGAASGLVGGSTGDMMAMGQSLMSEGLDMDQIKGVASETINFAKEKADADTVDQLVGSVPGLSSFL